MLDIEKQTHRGRRSNSVHSPNRNPSKLQSFKSLGIKITQCVLIHPLRTLRSSLMGKLVLIVLACIAFGSLLNFTDRIPDSLKTRVNTLAYQSDTGVLMEGQPPAGQATLTPTPTPEPIKVTPVTKMKFKDNEREFKPEYAYKKALDSSSDYEFQWKDWVDMTDLVSYYSALEYQRKELGLEKMPHLHITGPPSEITPEGHFARLGMIYLDSTMPTPRRLLYLTDKVVKRDLGYNDNIRDRASPVAQSNLQRRDDTAGDKATDTPEQSPGSAPIARLELVESDPREEDDYDDDDNGTIFVHTKKTHEELQAAVDLEDAQRSHLRPLKQTRWPAIDRQHLELPRRMFEWDVNEEIAAGMDETAAPEQQAHSEFVGTQWKHIVKSGKHFSEAWVNGDTKGAGVHFDWRFFREFKTVEQKQETLHRMLRAWLDFTDREGIITWLAHGTLLGWYWNGMSMPWDFDGDVQMPIREFDRFARLYNQTLVVQSLEDGGGRYYVDVGPTYVERLRGNGKNVIDARFIDVDTGMYIDITGLAYAEQQEKFHCKNWHRYTLEDVSPLRRTLFEGKPAYVPRNFQKILNFEYKKNPLHNDRFQGAFFSKHMRLWVDQKQCENLQIGPDGVTDQEKIDRWSLRSTGDVSVFGACYRPEFLAEYYATKDLTKAHQDEMKAIELGSATWEFIKDEFKRP